MPLTPIVVDIETFYSQTYSLRRLNYVEYAYHPEFELQMIGVRELGSAESTEMWVHDDPRYANERPVDFLNRWRYQERPVICHNAVFDVFMLSVHTGLLPPQTYCTQLGALYLWGKADGRAVYHNAPGGNNMLDSLGEAVLGHRKVPDALASQKGQHAVYGSENYVPMLKYLARDLDLTARLAMHEVAQVPKFQRWMIDWCVRAFSQSPLRLNVGPCRDELVAYDDQTIELMEQLPGVKVTDLSSNNKFAQLLIDAGVEPGLKPSPSNASKQVYALSKADEFMIDLKSNDDAYVRKLATAREHVKSRIGPTRAKRLMTVADLTGGYFPVHMQTAGAHTNRMTGAAGGGGNPLNFTRGSNLRRAIEALPGQLLVKFDYTGIELRIARWLANDKPGMRVLAAGLDTYIETIRSLRNISADHWADLSPDYAKELRRIGKVLSLASQYGTGWERALLTLKAQGVILTEREAREMIRGFRYDLHPALPEAWSTCETMLLNLQQAQAMSSTPDVNKLLTNVFRNSQMNMPDTVRFDVDGIIWPATQRKLRYANIGFDTDGMTYSNRPVEKGGEPHRVYGALCFENMCQSLTAEVIEPVQRTLEVDHGMRVALQVYDELVLSVPETSDIKAVCQEIKAVAEAPLDWWPDGPPLDVEFDVGHNYADMSTVNL